MKKIILIITLLFSITSCSTQKEQQGLTITNNDKEEVIEYWNNYQSKAKIKTEYHGLMLSDNNSIYNEELIPTDNYPMGELKQSAIDDTLHILNTIRFSLGLKEVYEYKPMSEDAQYSAYINSLNGEINHFPKVPDGMIKYDEIYRKGFEVSNRSNLDVDRSFLNHIEKFIKDDIGEDNKKEVGHRAWALSPALYRVGVGAFDNTYNFSDYEEKMNFFSLVVSNGEDYSDTIENQVFSYPGEIAISEFNSNTTPYSIFFGKNFELENAYVKVYDLNNRKKYKYWNRNGLYINNKCNYGYLKSLVFGADLPYEVGTKLKIEVEGIKKNGEKYPISFVSEYISIKKGEK